MTTVRSIECIPHVSDIRVKSGERLEVLESTGTLAQYVLRHTDGSGTYIGLAYTTRRVQPASKESFEMIAARVYNEAFNSEEPK